MDATPITLQLTMCSHCANDVLMAWHCYMEEGAVSGFPWMLSAMLGRAAPMYRTTPALSWELHCHGIPHMGINWVRVSAASARHSNRSDLINPFLLLVVLSRPMFFNLGVATSPGQMFPIFSWDINSLRRLASSRCRYFQMLLPLPNIYTWNEGIYIKC